MLIFSAKKKMTKIAKTLGRLYISSLTYSQTSSTSFLKKLPTHMKITPIKKIKINY